MSNTIGILLAGQQGDIMSAMSVLKYRNELWGDNHKLVWYSAKENFDLFAHTDIEVREFPRGFGYPEMVKEENAKLVAEGKEPIWEDWLPLVDWDNKMNIALQHEYPSLKEFSQCYFPAPHQIQSSNRAGVDYPNCSKRVFQVPMDYPWHPVLKFSEEERQRAKEFMDSLPQGVRNIFIETFAGSSQSSLTADMNERNMSICREHWQDCNFIFGSHKFLRGQEEFPQGFFERKGIYSCADFTVRQTALISGKCDLILSVSSGLTVAASCWENMEQEKIPPVQQFCGSEICGTRSLYAGEFELISADYKSFEKAQSDFHQSLSDCLIRHK